MKKLFYILLIILNLKPSININKINNIKFYLLNKRISKLFLDTWTSSKENNHLLSIFDIDFLIRDHLKNLIKYLNFSFKKIELNTKPYLNPKNLLTEVFYIFKEKYMYSFGLEPDEKEFLTKESFKEFLLRLLTIGYLEENE